MSLVIHELERVERRVLGAIRCVDATTQARVDAPLQVVVADANVMQNRSGLYVLSGAIALPEHAAAFDAQPGAPLAGSLTLTATIRDPSARYLPRLAAIALPRDPSPLHASLAESLFKPIDIAMHPASVAPVGVNWSVLRVSVNASAGGDALGGALLRVISDGKVIARGMTDWRGEALVPVPGVPVTTWSDDEDVVVVNEISASLELVFDPATGSRTPAADVLAGRSRAAALVDPDQLEAQAATLPHAAQAVQLAAGRSQSISFLLALP